MFEALTFGTRVEISHFQDRHDVGAYPTAMIASVPSPVSTGGTRYYAVFEPSGYDRPVLAKLYDDEIERVIEVLPEARAAMFYQLARPGR